MNSAGSAVSRHAVVRDRVHRRRDSSPQSPGIAFLAPVPGYPTRVRVYADDSIEPA
jgi:hypothetical protein